MKFNTNSARLVCRLILTAAVLGGASVFLTGCKPEQAAQSGLKANTLYTCGMHPQVVQDKPGNCPICGMTLTPVRKQATSSTPSAPGERKVKYYKSTMMPGEIRQTPGKDSMGMEMVPVYEDEAAACSIPAHRH